MCVCWCVCVGVYDSLLKSSSSPELHLLLPLLSVHGLSLKFPCSTPSSILDAQQQYSVLYYPQLTSLLELAVALAHPRNLELRNFTLQKKSLGPGSLGQCLQRPPLVFSLLKQVLLRTWMFWGTFIFSDHYGENNRKLKQGTLLELCGDPHIYSMLFS